MSGNAILKELVTASKAGRPAGICSVCSANEYVIEAAMEETLASGGVCLIEATANQVNQFGGYTGMTPADFVSFCRKIASRTGLDEERLIFGGDHLGPLVWSAEEEEAAMEKAEAEARALEEAAENPDVVSIKITLYRVARDSKIISALTRAAENGKDVLALVELRARFDEENNIGWSKCLEDAGVTVIYGLDELKV
ncbi:MAG: hypothetical protein EGQ07_01315, partial [Clostridiales bacterium]|nr:hypothetical protein [Clostridiales bacterium]